MPQVTQTVETDGTLIPTGQLPSVNGTGFDFREPTIIGSLLNQTAGACGTNCTGWDTCWIMANHTDADPVLQWWSPRSGIKMSIVSDQDALQLYSCPGITSDTKKIPRKRAHGGDGTLNEIYENYSCAVIEAEDYIDAINNPEWGRNVVYGPDRPYEWNAVYTFSTVNEDGSVAAPASAIPVTSNAAAAKGASSSSSTSAAISSFRASEGIAGTLIVVFAAAALL